MIPVNNYNSSSADQHYQSSLIRKLNSKFKIGLIDGLNEINKQSCSDNFNELIRDNIKEKKNLLIYEDNLNAGFQLLKFMLHLQTNQNDYSFTKYQCFDSYDRVFVEKILDLCDKNPTDENSKQCIKLLTDLGWVTSVSSHQEEEEGGGVVDRSAQQTKTLPTIYPTTNANSLENKTLKGINLSKITEPARATILNRSNFPLISFYQLFMSFPRILDRPSKEERKLYIKNFQNTIKPQPATSPSQTRAITLDDPVSDDILSEQPKPQEKPDSQNKLKGTPFETFATNYTEKNGNGLGHIWGRLSDRITCIGDALKGVAKAVGHVTLGVFKFMLGPVVDFTKNHNDHFERASANIESAKFSMRAVIDTDGTVKEYNTIYTKV